MTEDGRSGTVCRGALSYVSPWEWKCDRNEASKLITITPPVGAALYFNENEGSDTATPVGITRHRNYRVQLLNADGSACTNGSPALISLVESSGLAVRFDAATGKPTMMRSASGKVTTAEGYFSRIKNKFDGRGNLVSTYSPTKGLLRTLTGTNGELIVEQFAANAVTPDGDDYEVSGTPFKSTRVARRKLNGVTFTTITQQQRDMPEYVIQRQEEAGKVTITKGTGDDTIIRTIETHNLPGNLLERIETIRGINDVEPVSCNRTLKKFTHSGWLLMSETQAFNTPLARTTHYVYDDEGHVTQIDRPDGSYTRYERDSQGRVILEATPWAGGQETRIRTTYADSRFYDNRPATITESYLLENGDEVTLKTTSYHYDIVNLALESDNANWTVERETITVTAAGSNQHQVSIHETYGEEAECFYAAGKTRMTKAVNGVETHHTYNPCSEHGALYTHTTETKVDNHLVDAMSRKNITYIAEDGTTTREEEYIYSAAEGWLLLSSAAYEYDEEQRVIRTTRGNGRQSTTEWMCCGKLRETNEDGITTSYGYDTAHRLVETIRDEVRDGNTVITPETITTYVKDAADRTIQTRRDIGAMTTTERQTYDQLGRVVTRTDVLGRMSHTAYSLDGLTTTTTQPTGATLITTRHTDGSVAHVYGTGQRELYYAYGMDNYRLHETVMLGDQATMLSQTLTNGFGQSVVQANAVPGGMVYDRMEYNTKGQFIRSWREANTDNKTLMMAPTLYQYDDFGNAVKQTLLLDENADDDVLKNRIVRQAFSVEELEDGIYSVTTTTRYTAAGNPVTQKMKQMLSKLSSSLESKSLSINERSLTSTRWTEYNESTKRLTKQSVPTSEITAETVSVDGFMLSQKDTHGITSTQKRVFLAMGTKQEVTDGRGNTTTTVTDLIGRPLVVRDAAGNVTTTTYCKDSNHPATITNAQGKTTCYAYDFRGRKVAEFGTAVQPACFEYDDADRLVSLTTFRASDGDVTTNPLNRMDGDTTTWCYDDASGRELRKTYADGSCLTKTYDAFGNLATETNARGIMKTMSYDEATGQLMGMTYSDDATPNLTFAYNVQGQLTQVTDAAGTRTIAYNEYGQRLNDRLTADGKTYTITEYIDFMGRNFGFDYSHNGILAAIEQHTFGTDGRINSATFNHGGEWKKFQYEYLAGTNLLQKLTMPNNMTLMQQYELQRDLLTGMLYKRGETSVVERFYTYDNLGRPLTRQENRQGGRRSDTFMHNDRSELTAATIGSDSYAYAYDNIGNRKTAQENAEEVTDYAANNLNQYTAVGSFEPEFDADGNQTKVQTCTGIWDVTYNAENRPTVFSRANEDGTTTQITCAYDYMGRRATKKVETIATSATSNTILHQRYIYRNYLQVACCDLTKPDHPCLWFITWDPTQAVATRPLSIRKDGTWYCYGWDLTKNVCEVFSNEGYINNTVIYSYTPYGAVTAEGSVTQPIQWSSEFYDDELGLVYYNYRHYNPNDGRWLGRDLIKESANTNVYRFTQNTLSVDILGLMAPGALGAQTAANYGNNYGHGNVAMGLPREPGKEPNKKCRVHVCCKPAGVVYLRGHCVIRFTYSSGAVRGCRGGPTRNDDSGGSSGSWGSSHSGTGSSGSSANVGTGSNSQKKLCKGCCGYWGNVVAGCGKEIESPTDALSSGINSDLENAHSFSSRCTLVATYTDVECQAKQNCVDAYMRGITNKCYIYKPFGNNSNTSWTNAFKTCFKDLPAHDPIYSQPGNDTFNETERCHK